MIAASLHGSAVPVAAAPRVLWTSGGGATSAPATPAAAGGVTPAAGQGFQAASGASGAASSQDSAASAAAPSGTSTGAVPLEQGLAAFAKLTGDSFGDPVVAADGSVYAPYAKPIKGENGQLQLQFVKIGTVDKVAGTLTFTPAVLAKLKDAASQDTTTRKLVKIDDQYYYQTFAEGEDGATQVVKTEKATEQELQAEQAKREQAAAKQTASDDSVWQSKLSGISSNLGLFASAGGLVSGLSQGPNPMSGKPGASWLQGYILASRLNGKSGGKLLPEWMQTGVGAAVLDIGLQAYGMLDMGSDIRTLKQAFGKAPALPAVNPNAVQNLVQQGVALPEARALADLGAKLRTGQATLVATTGNAAMYVPGVAKDAAGALQQVTDTVSMPKSAVHQAFNATDAATDAGLAARNQVNKIANNGLGALGKLIEPALIGSSAINAYLSGKSLVKLVKQNGFQAVYDTQQGRNAALGAATSVAFLGMYTMPKVLGALGKASLATPVGAALNLAANVIGGVQMLDRYGLFGDKGFLNHDVVRAAFLIPPLTPIGGLAFLMKHRKDKREEEAAKLAAAQQLQKQLLVQQMQQATQQLQTSGTVAGATQAESGTITVSTGVSADAAQLAASVGATSSTPASASTGASAAPAATGPSTDRLAMLARTR